MVSSPRARRDDPVGADAGGRTILAEANRQLNPRDAEILANLAAYYLWLGQKEKTLPLLQQALGLAPNDAKLMFHAAEIYEELGRRNEAITWLAKAIKNGHSWYEIELAPGLHQLRAGPRFKQLRQAH